MASDNIFSGLKVVDLSSFIAGPGAAVILSDFGADVIKVDPPSGDIWRRGHQIPAQPQAEDPISGIWPTATSAASRSIQIPGRPAGPREARQMGGRVHRQHAAPGAQETEARIRRRRAMEPAIDLRGSHRFGEKGRTPTCRASISRLTGRAAACCR